MSGDSLEESVRGHLDPQNQVQGLYHGGGQQWESLQRDASIFGGATERARDEREAAARQAAAQRRAQEMAAQMFGGAYQGGQVIGGGGGTGMMASPMTIIPNQRPNMGLPGMQSIGGASRNDIAAYFAQLRQGVPVGGYNPLMPRTVMPTAAPGGPATPIQPGQPAPGGSQIPPGFAMPQQGYGGFGMMPLFDQYQPIFPPGTQPR